jgi:hypothetical protein
MPPLVALVIVAVIAAVVLIIVLVRRAERRRSEALEQVASEWGLVFEARPDVELLTSQGDLPLYSHGRARRARNMLSGRLGDDEIKVFDYQYTTGGGKEQHTHVQTVAVFPRALRGFPDMQLSPENVFHRIGQAFGYQDIDFESNPDFSARYLLRGADETAIRAALRPDVLAFFEANLGWTVEVRSGTAGVYRSGKRTKPEDVRDFAEEAHAILRQLGGGR